MTGNGPTPVTRLLRQWREGDDSAFEQLLPLVYAELRSIADRRLKGERAGHTLQPTALVHEAYLRLVSADIPWQDQAHFYAVAARTMRRVLVEHARARGRLKRGGDWVRATLETGLDVDASPPLDLIQLDQALDELAARDPRAARAAELHYFAGISAEDTARALDVSESTVFRDLRIAKAYLYRALSGE